jgi:hypothetical protein
VVAAATLAALVAIDRRLEGPASPAGIVSFEVCAYRDACGAIVDAWPPDAQLMAALSLGVDYLFMVAYPAAICLGLLLLVEHVPERLKRFTTRAAWIAWLAAAADAVENYCLAQMLLTPTAREYAWPAATAATVKFVVLGGTLGWLLVAYVRFVLSRPRPARAA